MNRLRPNTRIRPVRPYWSRAKIATVVAATTVAVICMVTAWLPRRVTTTVELDPSGPHRVQSEAGPVAVVRGPTPALHHTASWLISGPTFGVEDDRARTVRCDTWLPCRAASTVALPEGPAELIVQSIDDDVSVDAFDGTLEIETGHEGAVHLGPVAGTVTVATENGGVFGYGLTAQNMAVETFGGEVELRFATAPDRLSVRSGAEPVTIELPDGTYAVSVKGEASVAVSVGQASAADSEIVVEARGPVRIYPSK